MTEGIQIELESLVDSNSQEIERAKFATITKRWFSREAAIITSNLLQETRSTESSYNIFVQNREFKEEENTHEASSLNKEELQNEYVQALNESVVTEAYDVFKRLTKEFNPRSYGEMEKLFAAYDNLEKKVNLNQSTTFTELGSKSWVSFKALGLLSLCVLKSLRNTFQSIKAGIPIYDEEWVGYQKLSSHPL